ncbi:hypothetical protein SK128_005389, partial [Halocaridina rubra]
LSGLFEVNLLQVQFHLCLYTAYSALNKANELTEATPYGSGKEMLYESQRGVEREISSVKGG